MGTKRQREVPEKRRRKELVPVICWACGATPAMKLKKSRWRIYCEGPGHHASVSATNKAGVILLWNRLQQFAEAEQRDPATMETKTAFMTSRYWTSQ